MCTSIIVLTSFVVFASSSHASTNYFRPYTEPAIKRQWHPFFKDVGDTGTSCDGSKSRNKRSTFAELVEHLSGILSEFRDLHQQPRMAGHVDPHPFNVNFMNREDGGLGKASNVAYKKVAKSVDEAPESSNVASNPSGSGVRKDMRKGNGDLVKEQRKMSPEIKKKLKQETNEILYMGIKIRQDQQKFVRKYFTKNKLFFELTDSLVARVLRPYHEDSVTFMARLVFTVPYEKRAEAFLDMVKVQDSYYRMFKRGNALLKRAQRIISTKELEQLDKKLMRVYRVIPKYNRGDTELTAVNDELTEEQKKNARQDVVELSEKRKQELMRDLELKIFERFKITTPFDAD